VAATADDSISVQFIPARGDARLVSRAAQPPSAQSAGAWALYGFGATVVGLVSLVIVTSGFGRTYWASFTALGLLAVVFATVSATRNARRHYLALVSAGAPVTVTVDDALSHTCGGERVTLDWTVVQLQRRDDGLIVRGPRGVGFAIPSHACDTPAAFEALCGEIARRAHDAQTATA
jgi:hypothetical protein